MRNVPIPPALLVLTDDVIPAISTGWEQSQNALQAVEDNVISPSVNAILSAPAVIDDYLPHDYIPDWALAEGDLKKYMEDLLGFDRRHREVTLTRGDNIANQVTVMPWSNDPAHGQRTIWNMLAEDGDLMSGEAELQGNTQQIFAPFSLYYPTSMWPYSSPDGNRYTVHDLGNEPIESDFLGTKPIIEILAGRKLDKVGSLPAYSYWGDIALGTPPTLVWVGLGIIAVKTGPIWFPPITRGVSEFGVAVADGIAGIAYATAKGIRKAWPFKGVPTER